MVGTMEQPSIIAIDKVSVARICSGQVITDLATAVKELVENSLVSASEDSTRQDRHHGILPPHATPLPSLVVCCVLQRPTILNYPRYTNILGFCPEI